MAYYRNISTGFWTDRKVDDDFTPEDKYFYLYLITNPHTNICGCYEIGMKQMSRETGYNDDTIKRLLNRLQNVHNVIRYDENTKEVFIINWSKYNWSKSEKLQKAVLKVADFIKSEEFKNNIIDLINNKITISDILQNTDYRIQITDNRLQITDTDVCIGYQYPIDTVSEQKKEKTTSIDDIINDYTQNPELIASMKAFLKHRKALKSPMTDNALSLSLKKLDKLAKNDAEKIAIIEQSIERGWKGLFPLKAETPAKERDIYSLPDEDLTEQERIIKKLRC